MVVSTLDVGKCYHIYAQPQDRLKQALFRWRRQFYREFWALRDVTFEVRKGEALGIIGRNGSGKSTLLQIIAGTLQPTAGEVRTLGRVAALLELGSGFNPEFTGRENAYMNGAILGLSRGEIDERFDDIAAFADIGQFLDQPVKTYSSGMMVRLAFAVQVQMKPDILIVDEALAVGDVLFQKRCFQRIEELRANGVTLLFCSHDQETVRTLTTQAVLLHEGRIRSYGGSAEVVLDYRRLLHEEESRYFSYQMERARAKQEVVGTNARAAPSSAPERLSFGDYDAEIVAVQICNGGGEEAAVFYPGDKLVIHVQCALKRDLAHLSIGVRIRNKQGVKIYSWGTLNQDQMIWGGRAQGDVLWDRRFQKGQTIVADLECDCPLGVDLYEVQAVISEEQDPYYGAQRILHWRDEAAFFQVLMRNREYFFGGVCDLRMRARVRA